jgi:hypothetical protein
MNELTKTYKYSAITAAGFVAAATLLGGLGVLLGL